MGNRQTSIRANAGFPSFQNYRVAVTNTTSYAQIELGIGLRGILPGTEEEPLPGKLSSLIIAQRENSVPGNWWRTAGKGGWKRQKGKKKERKQRIKEKGEKKKKRKREEKKEETPEKNETTTNQTHQAIIHTTKICTELTHKVIRATCQGNKPTNRILLLGTTTTSSGKRSLPIGRLS